MSSSDLKSWPIFRLLEPEFVAQIHMAVVYGTMGNEALIMTKDKMVYALGSNTSGCLGTGDMHSTLYPKKIEALCEKGIKTFAYGSGPHVLALADSGEVYSWGHNGFCELGNGSTNQGLTPTPVNINLNGKHIVDIACGNHHSLALTEDGEVYAWGQNNCGQVGSGISTNQGSPRLVNSNLAGKKVICITCGQASSMAVTENGEVYGWGYNGVGQLGIGNYVNQVNPVKVPGLMGVRIVKVVCGHTHTLALTDEGMLYVWGGNSYGQLGTNNKTNACSPVMLTSDLMVHVEGKTIHVHKAILKIRSQYFRTMLQDPWLENSQSVIEHDTFSYIVYKAYLNYLYTGDVDLPPENALELLNLANLYIEKSLMRRCIQMIKHGITVLNVASLYSTAIEYNAKGSTPMTHAGSSVPIRVNGPAQRALHVRNASTADLQELEEFCFKFALNHMTAVTQTENFARLDEKTVKTFICKAAQSGIFKT
ncbi:PREDICTED: RCC1 and BTB domain-containing protein 1-like isoform X3 [Dinoponera quadriceps]|uniref:RCC1 and BTB domain-containing protein 1-like isoform X3 n=1 Tax=Dinoponera quadriceps TaxID=609295 RepID=A0A6P3WZU5_DINQU|nr:PREDICTED: RCC1 and BTB domain-containing protein 1-like isoform X3 [Dinoponera quadriceps]